MINSLDINWIPADETIGLNIIISIQQTNNTTIIGNCN